MSKYKILISFGNPERGRSLLRLADGFIHNLNGSADVTALHLSPSDELNPYNLPEYERESFIPVIDESRNLNRKITTLFKPSNDIDSDITEVANSGDFDLLLVGLGQSIFEGSLLGKVLGFTTRIINPDNLMDKMTGKEKLFENSQFDHRTRQILSKSNVPVGILIDKNLKKTEKVFVPVFDNKDVLLIQYVQKLINNSGAQVTILDAAGQIKSNPEIREMIRAIELVAPNHIHLAGEKVIEKEFLQQNDLMLISLESWKKLVESQSLWLNHTPSTLIMKA